MSITFKEAHDEILIMLEQKHTCKTKIEAILKDLETLREYLRKQQDSLAEITVDIDRYACGISKFVIDEIVGKKFMKCFGNYDRYYVDSIVDRDKSIVCLVNEDTNEKVQILVSDIIRNYFEV